MVCGSLGASIYELKTELTEFLEQCSPKWRTRKIQNYPNFIEYLNSIYPGVNINIQIDCFIKKTDPLCINCNLPVKFLGIFELDLSC